MGYLDELLAAVDNIKRVGARNISDLTSDPMAYAEKIVGHLRNQNAGVVPVAAGGELTNRPMTDEERVEQAMGSVDPGGKLGGGVIGSIRNQKFLRDMFEPRSFGREELRAGKHPELIFDHPEMTPESVGFRSAPPEKMIRYELADRPLYDKGVVHYDATGGRQIFDIIKELSQKPNGGSYTPRTMEKKIALSQLRVQDIGKIPESQATFTPFDQWSGHLGGPRPKLSPGEHNFYVNEFEGLPEIVPGNAGVAMPKIKDILNDPDLRYAYNLSLAVPQGSDFHQMARVLRDKTIAPPEYLAKYR